ncbi:MAG: InlB B-repeat-containing protein [Bacilli bacterium]|nr:InlB B-repeat-containing protein [Bacilli bacterium]
MKVRHILLSLSLLTIGSSASGVFAAWALSDKADSFTVQIALTAQEHTITFHMPDTSDGTCMSYTTSNAVFEYGDAFSTITTPDTSSFLTFNFDGWYSDSALTQQVNSTDILYDDIDVYAKFSRSNVLADSSYKYYLSNSSEQTVSSQYLYKVDNHVWGSSPTLSNSNKVDLTTSSGKYKLTYVNSAWSIKRVIGIGLGSDNTYWNTAGAKFRLWQFNGLDSLGDSWSGLFTFDEYNKSSIDIDYRYRSIIVARISNSNTPDQNWSNVWNKTHDVTLNGQDWSSSKLSYSSESARLYVWNAESDGKNQFGWGSW